MYYLCSKNNDANQLCSYFAADLCVQKAGFLMTWLKFDQVGLHVKVHMKWQKIKYSKTY